MGAPRRFVGNSVDIVGNLVEKRRRRDGVKVIVTFQEAVERGLWARMRPWFGRDERDEEELWPNEEFVLTEAQAQELGLLRQM